MNKIELLSMVNDLGGMYLASPFFNGEQLERVEYVRDLARKIGYKVFSPKDENLVSPDADADWKEQAFQLNIAKVKDCAFVLAITDGKDVGTMFEAGSAFSEDKPIVYFAETLGDNDFNLMLAQSGLVVTKDRKSLEDTLNDTKFMKLIVTKKVYKKYVGSIE